MLCSACNKNVAVIFINKVEDGKNSLEGLCYNCAKERGIKPEDVWMPGMDTEGCGMEVDSSSGASQK